MSIPPEILNVVMKCLGGFQIQGKIGKSHLQPTIARALREAGFVADEEDAKQLLPAGIPVWRSKDDSKVVPTTRRRLVDIVVYRNGQLAALIETESDLNDLRVSGVSKRNDHYDVASISKNSDGEYFDSYRSVERMAVAAFHWNLRLKIDQDPSPQQVVNSLESIQSDDPLLHNPAMVPILLVSGCCRKFDRPILSRRMESLNATLVCVNGE